MTELKRASFSSKEDKKLPKGSKIVSKEVSITVREIENGFIISKSFDIRYNLPGKTDNEYFYLTKEYFSKENPLEDSLEKIDDKMLADNFK